MSIDLQSIRNKISKVPDMRYITDSMWRCNVSCYRSRIPFFVELEAREISWLLSACCVPLTDWTKFNEPSFRNLYALKIVGTCTNRSDIYTSDRVANLLSSISWNAFGIQMNFVNVTNKAQYPVIVSYITSNNWEIVQRVTARHADRPVEYVIARCINHTQSDHNSSRYVCFTTLWDYDLNKSLLYVMLNHMLTTPFEDTELNRTAVNRAAYAWFTKYFEGQNVSSSILEYLNRELISKLHDIAKEQLKKSLETFGTLKSTYRDNTDERIRAEHERIHVYERSIDECYENIRQYTLTKLKQEMQGKTLDTLLGIFNGMLNKGILTGFCYRKDSEGVYKVAWRVQLPITYWEEDEAKYWLRELRDNAYKRDLFKAMFMDKLIVPYCEQTIMMDLTNGQVSNNALDIDTSSNTYPPHPHIGVYNCFGNNTYAAKRAIMDQDFITAVTICMNAAMQLNMTDHTVTSRFMRMCDKDGDYCDKAFLLYHGHMYTPIELYALYKLEGGFNNGETNQINPETAEENA